MGLAVLAVAEARSPSAEASTVLFDTTTGFHYAYAIATNGTAASFSSGSSPALLKEVDLNLALVSSPAGAGVISISLYSAGTNSYSMLPVPGTFLDSIGTLNESTVGSNPALFAFSLSSAFLLAANTQYWVVLSSTGSDAGWGVTTDQVDAIGTTGQYFTGGGASTPDFEPYNIYTNLGAYQMKVLATAVPEPSSFSLLIVACSIGVYARLAKMRRGLTD
jgi:hypothetical protein